MKTTENVIIKTDRNVSIYIDRENDLTAEDVLDVNKKLMKELENKN